MNEVYIVYLHDESDSVGVMTEEMFYNSFLQIGFVDSFNDVDFANYHGKIFAKEHNCDFAEFEEDQTPEIRSVTEGELFEYEFDTKTRIALEFDLKFCGNSYIDPNNKRIDPKTVKYNKTKDIYERI